MTTATMTKRDVLAGDLTRLVQEHTDRMVPLQDDLDVAVATFEDANAKLEIARSKVQAASQAVSTASSRCATERSLAEARLRSVAPGSIAAFAQQCRALVDELQATTRGSESERVRRASAAHAALQNMSALELLDDDELETRLSELRAAIAPATNDDPVTVEAALA